MEYIRAFLLGGLLCALGQILIDRTALTPAKILTGYVTAGVLLSALGVYQPLADWGGAGATVPLTGFGHLLARGVRKAVAEQGLLGTLTGGVTAAAGGITAAIFFGFVVAAVFTGYLLTGLTEGRWKNLLFCPTGALHSPVATAQGESIPGICHAVALTAPEGT